MTASTASTSLTDHERWMISEARRIAPVLRRRASDAERLGAELLSLLADLTERLAEPAAGRCGDHHASGVTNCTREAGHGGAHHNGSGLTWGGL